MLEFFAPWFLCLVLGNVLTTPVESNEECCELDSRFVTTTTQLGGSLVRCTDQVTTLSNLIVNLTHQCCGRFEGLQEAEALHFPPMDCHDLLLLGYNTSGVYHIYPSRCQRKLSTRVYCDMETDGGGWTVFLMRKEQKVQENFTRTWEEYSKGFGDPQNEYWLGNGVLHALTTYRHYVLRADMEDFEGSSAWAEYDTFAVGSKDDFYRLSVTGYEGNAGDAMATHNKRNFSTAENDHDSASSNCAQRYKGGWWYGACHQANPTGIYHKGEHESYADGVNWKPFKGYYYSLKTVSLKIRPRDCPSFELHSL